MPFVGQEPQECQKATCATLRIWKGTYSAAAVLWSPGRVSPPLTSLVDLRIKQNKPKVEKSGLRKGTPEAGN